MGDVTTLVEREATSLQGKISLCRLPFLPFQEVLGNLAVLQLKQRVKLEMILVTAGMMSVIML